MRLRNKILELTKRDCIEIIQNNPDLTSKEIDQNLITTIKLYYGRFTVKQLKWLTFKISYIVRHYYLYKNYKGMKDIFLVPEIEPEVNILF